MGKSTHSSRISAELAIALLDLAIDSGATYAEIEDACKLVPELMMHSTAPTVIYDAFGKRHPKILGETIDDCV